jgi:hypothetical protein
MSGIDQEIKDFVQELDKMKNLQIGVESMDGNQKTADQDIPKDLPGIVNGPAGTAKWGIGKLHHVISCTSRILTIRASKNCVPFANHILGLVFLSSARCSE